MKLVNIDAKKAEATFTLTSEELTWIKMSLEDKRRKYTKFDSLANGESQPVKDETIRYMRDGVKTLEQQFENLTKLVRGCVLSVPERKAND